MLSRLLFLPCHRRLPRRAGRAHAGRAPPALGRRAAPPRPPRRPGGPPPRAPAPPAPTGQDVVVGRRWGTAVPLHADAVEGASPAEPAVGVRGGGARRALQALWPYRQHQERRRRQPQPGPRRVRKFFPRPLSLPPSRRYRRSPNAIRSGILGEIGIL
jgi:hypothetical protein